MSTAIDVAAAPGFIIYAPAISAVVATCAFLFTAWLGLRNARRESIRRDWERLQAIAQVMHDGVRNGLWAQKLAVQELTELSTRKTEALLLARQALTLWEVNNDPIHLDMCAELRTLILRLSR